VKVAAQEIENSQVVLDIEVEDERLQKAVDQAYRRIVNRINVPGFRKGKAPRALVERMVGREALVEDAVEHLVPEVVEAAVKEQELKMVARPRLEVISTQPLQVKATVPVQPTVELGDYQSLTIDREEAAVDDDQVSAVIDRLRDSHATWEPVERAVALGDRVVIDLRGEVGEEVILDSTDAEYIVDPEGPEPAPGFANQLVGMATGDEREFELTLPDDYRNRELQGQPAHFTVSLHEVKERRLPELDDELASTVSTEYETAEQLRDSVRGQLLDRERQERQHAHEQAVLQAVIDQAKVQIPPQLVEAEAQRLLETFAGSLDRQGISVEQYLRFTNKSEPQFRAELMAQGEQSVRQTEVLDAVARQEGLEATDDEIREEIARASSTPADVERLSHSIFDSPEAKERVASIVRRHKAVRYLMETIGGVSREPEPPAAEPAAIAAEDAGETSS